MDLSLMLAPILATVSSFGLDLLYALVVLLVGWRLIGWFLHHLKKSQAFLKLDPGVSSFLLSALRILFYILLILSIVSILGLPTTSFITMLASGGVAIGLALQGALSNFAGGLMLLFFKPFHVGDFIEAGGFSGTVKEITVFYTVLYTADNKRVTLPNGNLTNAAVINYTNETARRVDLTFSAAYDCDIDQVKDIIAQVMEAHPLVLKGEGAPDAPFVRMSAQKDSCLEYTLRAWCRTEDYWTVYFDLNEQVKKAFDAHQIEIPFPQLDVHTR